MILSAPGTAAQERLSLTIPQILRLSEEIRPGWVALTSALTGLGPGNDGVSCRDLFTQCADGWRRTGPKRESGRARVRLAEEAVSAGSSCGSVRNGAWIRSTKSTSKKKSPPITITSIIIILKKIAKYILDISFRKMFIFTRTIPQNATIDFFLNYYHYYFYYFEGKCHTLHICYCQILISK
jgi:hypothetical protein